MSLGEELTPKQLEVLELLAPRYRAERSISAFTFSLNTVKTQQRALYRTPGVEDRSTAVKQARRSACFNPRSHTRPT